MPKKELKELLPTFRQDGFVSCPVSALQTVCRLLGGGLLHGVLCILYDTLAFKDLNADSFIFPIGRDIAGISDFIEHCGVWVVPAGPSRHLLLTIRPDYHIPPPSQLSCNPSSETVERWLLIGSQGMEVICDLPIAVLGVDTSSNSSKF